MINLCDLRIPHPYRLALPPTLVESVHRGTTSPDAPDRVRVLRSSSTGAYRAPTVVIRFVVI
jgi:hypothetical protein